MSDSVSELVQFLQIGARLDLKDVALDAVLGLTATENGIISVIAMPNILASFISLLDDNSGPISRNAARCLVNISAHEKGAKTLLSLDPGKYSTPLQNPPNYTVIELLKHIFNKDSYIADQCCMILSNLTRSSIGTEKVIDFIDASDKAIDDIINVFTKIEYNTKGAKMHYLGPLLSNLSQSSRARKFILDKQRCVIQRLLPFIGYNDSLIRRGGVVGTLKNCCFETEYHEWLLSEDVDILPSLLLPLAGNEEFDEEDTDKLPLELQYLPETKLREEDPDIRLALLNSITQLCTKRNNRELIRNKNAYVIMREMHKWEKDEEILNALESLVNILIRTEDEIGEDNLKDVNIPEDLQQNLLRMD